MGIDVLPIIKRNAYNHDRNVINKIQIRLDLCDTIIQLTVLFQATEKCCSYRWNAVIILGMSMYLFFYSVKITLTTGDCKTGNKLIVVEMMCSDGMQILSGLVLLYPISIWFWTLVIDNTVPPLVGKNIHLRVFFQLQNYLPEAKYFCLEYDSTLKNQHV